jgi:lipopolysaccharide export system protein LptA
MKFLQAAVLSLLLLPAIAAAATPQEAGSLPIEVTADRLSAESGGGSVTFDGNVVAKQGDVTMYSNRLYAEYSRKTSTIERIEAEGAVRFLQEGKEVKAGKATLFNMEQRVVFSGGATLRQGGNTVQGETITVYLNENRAVVKGSEGGGRVKAVINPKEIKGVPKP